MTRSTIDKAEYRGEAMAVRSVIGGALMGLANLLPGISGGTMLLAVGVYPQFVNGIAELSTFRFRAKTILLMACIIGAALLAIVGFAGVMSHLVVHHRWVMYSLFIGLTLGGVPVLWPMVRPADPVIVLTSIIGIAVMAAMALIGPASSTSATTAESAHPYAMYFIAGLAGASAMVLPGISGGYLLLVLGQYVAILTAISTFKDGLQARDWNIIVHSMHVIIPVGAGVVIGVVGVSNLVKILLDRWRRPTLGLLLGLLLGAVLGLWPFQQGVAPEVGSSFRGDVVVERNAVLALERTGRLIEPKDYDTAFFTPTTLQVLGAAGLILAGLALSWGVSRLGSDKPPRKHAAD